LDLCAPRPQESSGRDFASVTKCTNTADCLEITADFCSDWKMKKLFPVFCVFSCLLAAYSFAGSATWSAAPSSSDWNTATNWSPATVPNGPSDIATFGVSNIVGLSTSANTEVNGIVFSSGASSFAISAGSAFPFSISGAGITNNSGLVQNFVGGTFTFTHSAVAADLTTFTASGGMSSGDDGGTIAFFDSASAGNATLIANGGTSGAGGGAIQFFDNSSGGTANVQVFGNGSLELADHAGGLTIGSLAGEGSVDLGANTLTLDGFNRSTVFSGRIGGTGGIYLMLGTLQLTRANSFSGGFTFGANDGLKVLVVSNPSGSATGSGPVIDQYGGILCGSGSIDGPVTINDGSFLWPRYGFTTPQRLRLRGGVSLPHLGRLAVTIDLDSLTYDSIIANGVALGVDPVASVLTVSTTGSTKIPIGTVFKIIKNVSTSPITGNFFSYPEGSYVNLGSKGKLQVSYVGGDGNDFTLTAIR
jgi:hypothetical protein